ncbi:MAG: M14 family metallopeptidase [bacterium]|nr:M14 family metallopeptidase [bacterium]
MSPIILKRIIFVVISLGIIVTGFLIFRAKETTKTPLPQKIEVAGPTHTVIGQSVEGRNIEAYTYGHGQKLLMLVGGIHGGYEWNSVVLAYEFLDYLNANPKIVPDYLTVVVIPSANPDGVYKIIGKEGRFTSIDVPKGSTAAGRFNANKVDLNRNFDCNWQATSTWQSKEVSAGTAPFSEPEAKALRDFILSKKPLAVVFWHSQSGAVYASGCNNGILPETLKIMAVYAAGADYKALKTFDSYAITGDAEGWLSSIGIPAITVELTTHEVIEWQKNLGGIKALFEYYK